jgi:ribosomal protein L32
MRRGSQRERGSRRSYAEGLASSHIGRAMVTSLKTGHYMASHVVCEKIWLTSGS